MDGRSDRTLVRASQRGDVVAFTALARRHWKHAYAVAYSQLLRHEDAEDVAQDTFLRAYSHLSQLKAETPSSRGSAESRGGARRHTESGIVARW